MRYKGCAVSDDLNSRSVVPDFSAMVYKTNTTLTIKLKLKLTLPKP